MLFLLSASFFTRARESLISRIVHDALRILSRVFVGLSVCD